MARMPLRLWLVFCVTCSAWGFVEDPASLRVCEIGQWRTTHYAILKDSVGQRFVLKQLYDPRPKCQLELVVDWLWCAVGREVGIPVNQVMLIPTSVHCPGKLFPDRPATLHTFVSGTAVVETDGLEHLQLQQRRPMGRRLRSLHGLTRTVVRDMAFHEDLPPLVALHTYAGNCDGTSVNIFYDSDSDHFMGIDLADSCCCDLVKVALFQVEAHFFDREPLSEAEALALEQYCATLRLLCESGSADALKERLLRGVELSGLPLGDAGVKHGLALRQGVLERNVAGTRTLICAIDALLLRERS